MSGLTKFMEIIARTNSPRKISRVLRRDTPDRFESEVPYGRASQPSLNRHGGLRPRDTEDPEFGPIPQYPSQKLTRAVRTTAELVRDEITGSKQPGEHDDYSVGTAIVSLDPSIELTGDRVTAVRTPEGGSTQPSR